MNAKRHGILLALGILALATVSVAATIQLLYYQLPEPEMADGPGLIRWMVLRDLSQETPQMRLRLVVRVQQVLADVLAASDKPIDEQFDPQYRPQFWRNVDVLMEEWFLLQAELYRTTPPKERSARLDKILDDAQWLSDFKPSQPASSGEQSSSTTTAADDPVASAADFMKKLNTWIEHAPAKRQPELRHFAAALQARMAARAFQGFFKALGA